MKNPLFCSAITLYVFLFTSTGFAGEVLITCSNKQTYPTIALKGDITMLSKPGTQRATLVGLTRPVKVRTVFTNRGHNLELTIIAANGNQTIMSEVKNSEDASNVWDGTGTSAYGGFQAEADYKALFGNGVKDRVMAVQQYSKSMRYPRPGGFCILSTR